MVRKMEALTAEEWNGVRIFEEAQQGNEQCSKVIQTFYEELAFGVFNVQHMLDPEMILFGGAISARTYRQDANLLGALAHYRQRRGLAE